MIVATPPDGEKYAVTAPGALASLIGMKRLLLALVVPLALLWSGCAQVMGTADWDRIDVTFQAGSTQNQTGNYTLTATPTRAEYVLDGKPSTHDLPQGVWDVLTGGVRTLGDRDSEACPGGEYLVIEASAQGAVKQTFQASSCDAGGVLDQAKALIEQVVQRLQ